jgi:pimeloyl-ACP methyl ester carboxylesterase
MSHYDNAHQLLDSGLTIHFHREGRSENTLVMLHGLNAHSGSWRKNIPHFSRTRIVIAPSFPPTLTLDPIEEYTNYVNQLLLKLDIRSASLIGNSMGGWIAMRLAILYPTLINSLVLEDTAGVSQNSANDLASSLNETKISTLVIWGENDNVIPIEAGMLLNSLLEHNEFIILKGAGHVPHWEKPLEFNAIVERFLLRNGL